MNATVIKLKASVNNPELPVLGYDGNIYDGIVGCYLNKLVECGYTPTNTEKSAISTFIESGKTKGWLNAVQYILPFIGDSDHPFAGCVPLVDVLGNYAMAEYSGSEDYADSFDYNGGKIVGLGGNASVKAVKTPLLQGDTANVFVRFSPYGTAKTGYTSEQYFFCSKNDAEENLFGICQRYGMNLFQDRTLAGTRTWFQIANPVAGDMSSELNIFESFENVGSSTYIRRFVATTSQVVTNQKYANSGGNSSTVVPFSDNGKINVGRDGKFGLFCLKFVAIFDIEKISQANNQQIADLADDVNTLLTAIGR